MDRKSETKTLEPERWLRIEEAAKYAQVTVHFIRMNLHAMRAVKAGNRYVIDRNDIDAFLEHMIRERMKR